MCHTGARSRADVGHHDGPGRHPARPFRGQASRLGAGNGAGVRWHLERMLHDDPEAVSAWCDAVDLVGPHAPEATIIAGIRWISTPVWKLLLDRLRSGSPALQASILRALSNLVQECADDDGDFSTVRGILRINSTRWAQVYEVVGAIDPESLLAVRLLPTVIDDVFETVDKVLEATGGALDKASGLRASQELRRTFETSFGAILAASTEDEVRQGLHRLGRSTITEPYGAEAAIVAVRDRRTRPDADGRPWTGLLTEWARHLLSRRRRDGADLMERDVVLQALAAAAAVEPESFRDRADPKILSRSLAEVGLQHDSWPGRAAAARLLGLLRYGSPVVFQALQQMLGAPRSMSARPRLRRSCGCAASISASLAISAPRCLGKASRWPGPRPSCWARSARTSEPRRLQETLSSRRSRRRSRIRDLGARSTSPSSTPPFPRCRNWTTCTQKPCEGSTGLDRRASQTPREWPKTKAHRQGGRRRFAPRLLLLLLNIPNRVSMLKPCCGTAPPCVALSALRQCPGDMVRCPSCDIPDSCVTWDSCCGSTTV